MSELNVSVRTASAGDWPVIAALLQDSQLPLDGAQQHLQNYLVAISNGEVIATAGMELYGNVALLRSVAVAPGLQRQGLGRLLVTQLLEDAKTRQIFEMALLTINAVDYFEQFGFKRRSRDAAPTALQASSEFQGACPDTAVYMSCNLASTSAQLTDLPVAVLGAGPAGLAAAGRLLERGIPAIVLEAGSRVGANLLQYGHVQLFSPWRYNVDHMVERLLTATGWTPPPSTELPLAREVVERVLEPFAALPAVAKMLRLNTKVLSVSREGFDKVKSNGREKSPFIVHAVEDGQPMTLRARAVIDATGTWNTPNPVGASGLPADGEVELRESIHYGIPDILGAQRERYAGRRTLVVGAGHSAANALLALAELASHASGTQISWTVRSLSLARVFGGGAADALPARGQLGASLKALRDEGKLEFIAGLRIASLQRVGHTITVSGTDASGRPIALQGFDEIICATGQRPNLAMTSELRLKLDPWLESTEALGPLIDPNVHSCGTVRPHGHRELAHPEPGFYSLGIKSYGRAPTFLMATGFEQARSVVAAIAGDLESADRVELDLPDTGVCSAAPVDLAESAGSSCGTSSCGVPAAPTVKPVTGGCGPKSCGTPTSSAPAASKKCCG